MGLGERDRQAAWDLAREVFTTIQVWDDYSYDREDDYGDRLRDAPEIADSWAQFRYDVDLTGAWLQELAKEENALEKVLRRLSDALEQMARMLEGSEGVSAE